MSRFEFAPRGYQPLSEAELGTPRIDFALNLPEYLNTDKIGINVRRIHMMMRLGGIRSLTIEGKSGETETVTPSIVGGNEEGAVAGTRAIIKKVPKSMSLRSNESGDREYNSLASKWTDARVIVNLSQMQDELSQAGQLRSEKAWAKEINKAITKELTEQGTKHLLMDMEFWDYFDVAASLGYTGVSTSFHLEEGPLGAIRRLLLYNLGMNIMNRYVFGRKYARYNDDGYRWSAFVGPQFDRAVILQTMAKSGRVAKEISAEPIK